MLNNYYEMLKDELKNVLANNNNVITTDNYNEIKENLIKDFSTKLDNIKNGVLIDVASEVLTEKMNTQKIINECEPAEKVIREKLTEYHRDNFDDYDWHNIFDNGTTDDIIDALYNSFCDDCFWAMAGITLTEIMEYFDEKHDCEQSEYAENFTHITSYYLTCAKDLLK